MTDRAYCANLGANAYAGVTVRELRPDNLNLVDTLARNHNVGRSKIVSVVLD